MPTWKQAVASAFDGAEGYDGAAVIQAVVAERLIAAIAAQAPPPEASVLEIGCGTGLLTGRLRALAPAGRLIATDIAPGMALRCRARLGADPGFSLMVMDGERPCLAPGFDLIASSLAAQWFEDLPRAMAGLAALLAPGGLLAVATLGSGTFREWREAHEALGLEAATPRYPSPAALAALRAPGCATAASVEPLVEAHADGRAFLAALRAIGAQTSGSRPPLSAGALRAVLRAFEARGARVTYEVATLMIRKQG